MSPTVDPIQVALSQSMHPGLEFAPSELLLVVRTHKAALPTLMDSDSNYAQREALERDFDFLAVQHATQQGLAPGQQERLTGLMRWSRRQLTEWTLETDSEGVTLAALFAITAFCSRYAHFWRDLSSTMTANPAIVAHLSKQIADLQATLSTSSLSRTPLSDDEALSGFLEADRQRDWALIASEWPRFGDFLAPGTYLSQSVLYLNRFARNELTVAMEEVRQTASVMLVLWSLSTIECLSLGKGSTNPYVQFGSVLRLLQHRGRNDGVSEAEEDLLTQLLQVVAEDSGQWERWMHALNRYPVRYPQLQRSLGKTLVNAPEPALKQYINSISLDTTGTSRLQVAECLRSFRAGAHPDRRKSLWTLAHDKWLEWHFGESEGDQSLVGIGRSDLDFAIVGYALECMNVDELSARCSSLTNELFVIGEMWHRSEVAFIETSSRILSTFQPYAYARNIDGEDWLSPEGKYFLPFHPQAQRYAAMFFHIRSLIPGYNAQRLTGEPTGPVL